MTKIEWETMTDIAKRSHIAKLCGWFDIDFRELYLGSDEYTTEVLCGCHEDFGGAGTYYEVPAYLTDLDAMYEAEELLGDRYDVYAMHLQGVYEVSAYTMSQWDLFHADIETRAMAFALTMDETGMRELLQDISVTLDITGMTKDEYNRALRVLQDMSMESIETTTYVSGKPDVRLTDEENTFVEKRWNEKND